MGIIPVLKVLEIALSFAKVSVSASFTHPDQGFGTSEFLLFYPNEILAFTPTISTVLESPGETLAGVFLASFGCYYPLLGCLTLYTKALAPLQFATLLGFDHKPELRFIVVFLPHQHLPFSFGVVLSGTPLPLSY